MQTKITPSQHTALALASSLSRVSLDDARDALIVATGNRVSYTSTERTLNALVKGGLLSVSGERYMEDWTITDAGRAAIEAR
jgi:hypothetical protein